jgi:aminopeptidase YwaD
VSAGIVSARAIERHVALLTEFGPRHGSNPTAVDAALRYLTDELTACGLTVAVQRWGPEPFEINLTAAIGAGRAPAIELGAHWDTVAQSPGADDNASGVAGVLVAAKALTTAVAVDGWRPARPVRFCLYGGEEDGFLGSTAHVRRCAGVIDGAFVLEMIGYRDTAPGSQELPRGASLVLPDVPRTADFIAVLADPASADLADAVARHAGDDLDVRAVVVPPMLRPVVNRSDHVPYWRAGLRAVTITDTAEYRNPHYHRLTDVIGTLDLEFAAAVTRAVTGAVIDATGRLVP